MRFDMNMKTLAAALVLMLAAGPFQAWGNVVPEAGPDRFKEALALYEKGMYSRARNVFDLVGDEKSEAYSVLCAIRMNEPGYTTRLSRIEDIQPYCGLLPEMYLRHALNLFDAGEYADALGYFRRLKEKQVPKAERTEYLYKSAYSMLETGQMDSAMDLFRRISDMPVGDYSAPARYGAGYILYDRERFSEALPWFEQAAQDPRFEEAAMYYVMECHFMLKDYGYVTAHGAELYEKIPQERRPHLARMISEAFLISGDAESAREYYDRAGEGALKERSDYFYAGTLMYTMGDYRSAIENYGRMTERTDSIGQIADYNMGYSYIQTRNKVAALDAFKAASEHDHDPRLTEDAFFNYAKLAFDLNDDNSVFNSYLERYSDKVKGDAIYSYMALSALYDKDYAGAIAAYDNIDELDVDMKANYMQANYLRAEQLIAGGSWRNAVPCLRAAAYYSDRLSFFNQLSRYWLAQSYFNNGQYPLARNLFTELYNASALDGKPEGGLIPYDLAYCYFKEKNYDMASRWFSQYLKGGDLSNRRDAMVRLADCSFAMRKYPEAAQAYEDVIALGGALDDLYPHYQAGISYALAGKVDKEVAVLSGIRSAESTAAYYDEAWYALGRAQREYGDEAASESSFLHLADNANDRTYAARALLDLGSICRDRKDYERSLAYYKKVVADMPESDFSRDALTAIEMVYQAKGEPESYIAYLDSMGGKGVTADVDREEVLFNAAEQFYLAGNWQRAIVSLGNYLEKYPQGRHVNQTDFYVAESYRNLGRKEQAIDNYAKVLARADASFREPAALNSARLSYELENYGQALSDYQLLLEITDIAQYRHVADYGAMNAAYMAKQPSVALQHGNRLLEDELSTDEEILDARLICAKARLSMSEREAALEGFRAIADKTRTPQGAEAAYMLIQDSSDRGDFKELEDLVYGLADSGCDQNYWMAKAFLLLGDSFVERENYVQARATFESVRDGYTAAGPYDDVPDNVAIRLKKLEEMGK